MERTVIEMPEATHWKTVAAVKANSLAEVSTKLEAAEERLEDNAHNFMWLGLIITLLGCMIVFQRLELIRVRRQLKEYWS